MEKEIIKYSYIHGVSFADEMVPEVFPSHWHDSAEFILVIKDGCKFRIGENLYSTKTGDVLFVWPRELHEIVDTPKHGYILLQFSSNLVESSIDIATAIRFLSKFHHISIDEEPELCMKISDQIHGIMDIYYSKEHFVETKCKMMIYNILLLVGEYVMHEHKELIGNEQFSDITWDYIRSACSYISDHFAEDISQAEVASVIGLSPFYFSKIFKEYTHMTFPSYLANIRVQSAINLLADKELSITDCAFQAGFQSTTTFNKVFRETTGYTPREYRRMSE